LNPNVTKVRKDWTDYFNNILSSGHGSVLEHASYSFAIEGVSRVFTGEMNRHRAGVAISEGSMRYIRFEDIPWWMPDSIQENPTDDIALREKKVRTKEIFGKVFSMVEQYYADLVKVWEMDKGTIPFHVKKKITSCLRRIIPMGVATGGVWTMNLRAVRHIVALRASEAAEEEICKVFTEIGRYMCSKEPRIFGDFTQDADGFWIPVYKKV
jgi:thymidylate synthase (FAD)